MRNLIETDHILTRWTKSVMATNVYVVSDFYTGYQIWINKFETSRELLMFGMLESNTWYSVGGFVMSFSKYFLDWQNPTKNEIILFELETGLMYIDYYLGLRTWSYEG